MNDAPAPAPSRRRVAAGFVALATVASIVTVYTAHHAFPKGSGVLDESAYQSQANTLAAGHLTLPASTHDPYFRPFLAGVRDGRVVFKYQPVWPALIAASEGAFGSSLPARVLMSIAGMLAVAWLAWELVRDRRVALVAGALVVASPFVWVQSASLLGYHLSFVLGAASAAAVLRAARVKTVVAQLLAGALLGLAILHRPFDAVIAVAPVAVYALWQLRRQRALLWFVTFVIAGALPFAAIFFAYNQAVMGSILRMPFTVSGNIDKLGFGWRASFVLPNQVGHGGQIHYTPAVALHTLQHVFAVIPRFIAFFPAVVVCLGIAIWARRKDARLWLLVSMLLVIIAGYFFWWGNANAFHFGLEHGLGPFYEYPLLVPLFVAAAWGFISLRSTNAKIALVFVGIMWTGWSGVQVVRDARVDGASHAAVVASFNVPPPALMFEPPLFPNDPYLRYANDASLRNSPLVAIDAPGRRLDVIDRFPRNTAYIFRTYQSAGDPFGKAVQDRVPLNIVRGTALNVRIRGAVRDADSYFRVDSGTTQHARGPENSFTLAAGALPPPGTSATVTAGVVVPRTGEWYECRFEVRATTDRRVEAIMPCDGWHHYVFPNGATTDVHEDVSAALPVDVTPA